MADLADAAKLSCPALYLVYPGEAEVFEAAAEWMSEKMLEAIQASINDEWPLERKLLHDLELSIAKGYDELRAHPDAADLHSLDHEVPAVEHDLRRAPGVLRRVVGCRGGAVKESFLKVTSEERSSS